MSLRRVMVFLLIPAAPLLAQLVNNTVTVTASQSSTAHPDEAVFSVVVGSGLDKSLDDAVAAISSLGITAANLVAVNTPNQLIAVGAATPAVPPLFWTFQLTVPVSKTKDTTSALAALQKSISQNNSGLTLSFTLSGTRLSAQQTPNCNLANLVSQARAQAQDIAAAAGFKARAVVGLSSATSNAAPLYSLTARFGLGAMFGQPGPNTITITATRTNAIQPDQVLIALNVQSPTTAGLDDITGALTAAGISSTNFTGVTTFYSYTGITTSTGNYPINTGITTSTSGQSQVVWSFTLKAPLAKLSATLTEIISAEQAISANNSGLTLTFYVEGMQVSQQLQQAQPCSQAALLADAQAQAKQVTAAAGLSAGPVLSMDSVASAALQLLGGSFYSQAVISVASPTPAVLFPTPIYTTPQTTCSLTVEFQLM